MRPVTVTVGPLATADADGVAASQSVSGAAAVTLDGALVTSGVAIMDLPRRIIITSAGDDTGITFTITGTTFAGSVTTDVVTGANNAAASSVVDFKTVTRIVTSGSTAADITVGTNGVAGTEWVRFDPWAPPEVSIQANVTGTVNYTLQQTLDDPNSPTDSVAVRSVVWVSSNDTAVVAATATQQSNYAFTPIYARVLLNSGTGSVTTRFVQSGAAAL